MVGQHVEALRPILLGKRNAGAFQRLALTVTWPGPAEIFAPGTNSRRVLNWRRFFQPMHSVHVDNIAIAVPYELDGGKRMVPAEVHAADPRPMTRKIPMLADDLGFLDREDATAA